MKQDRSKSEDLEVQARYAYYRQCQTVMQNGKQCRCPAQKGSDTCRNHAGQSQRLEKRRAAQAGVLQAAAEKMASRTGRKHRPEEVFRSWVGIRAALHEVGQATIAGRLDEDGAAELLAELETAALQIGRSQNFFDDLSNSGPAVRLYGEGKATGPPQKLE